MSSDLYDPPPGLFKRLWCYVLVSGLLVAVLVMAPLALVGAVIHALKDGDAGFWRA